MRKPATVLLEQYKNTWFMGFLLLCSDERTI